MIKAISLISICIVFFIFNVNLNAAIAGNEGEKAYCGGSTGIPCPPAPPKAITQSMNEGYTGPTILELIIEGGGYMLQSSSYINGFLNKIEISELSPTGPDFKGLQKALNASIYYMEKASDVYFQLIILASVTPYNQEVIYRLIQFDYDAFQKENGLIPTVYSKVRDLLSEGDVTGVFYEFYSYTTSILDLLYTLKKDIDYYVFPEISTVWSVNQKYSEFKLFGQYTAQIFYGIK